MTEPLPATIPAPIPGSRCSVRELLDHPDYWVTGKLAADVDGRFVWHDHPDAVRWSLVGAIAYCYPTENFPRLPRNMWPGNILTELENFLEESLINWENYHNREFDDVRALIILFGL